MDLRERLESLAEQNSAPRTWNLTDEQLLVEFEQMLRDGLNPQQAAKQLGKTASYMRGFRSEKSPRYDPDHAERYEEIMAGEHREALILFGRTALVEQVQAGNVRAIEKLLAAYDPDFSFMRPLAAGNTYNIESLVQLMPGMPTHLLQEMKAVLLEQQRQLPVIDAA